jgi:hypothetical protein
MNDKIDNNEKECDNVVINLENGATIELGPLAPPVPDFVFTIKEEEKENDNPST